MTKIYVLKNPCTNEIRYVGKTIRPLKDRLAQHIRDAKKGNNYRCNWIKSLKIKPVIEEIAVCSDSESNELEIFYIDYFKKLGFRLVNSTNGGDGGLGRVKTPEEINKFKKSMRLKAKIIYKYTKTGEYLDKFECAADAVLSGSSLDINKIYNCCNNKRKSHGNFIWAFEEPNKFDITNYKHKVKIFLSKSSLQKKVKVTNLHTNEVTICPSLGDAATITRVCISGISGECNNKMKTKSKFKFEFHE